MEINAITGENINSLFRNILTNNFMSSSLLKLTEK